MVVPDAGAFVCGRRDLNVRAMVVLAQYRIISVQMEQEIPNACTGSFHLTMYPRKWKSPSSDGALGIKLKKMKNWTAKETKNRRIRQMTRFNHYQWKARVVEDVKT